MEANDPTPSRVSRPVRPPSNCSPTFVTSDCFDSRQKCTKSNNDMCLTKRTPAHVDHSESLRNRGAHRNYEPQHIESRTKHGFVFWSKVSCASEILCTSHDLTALQIFNAPAAYCVPQARRRSGNWILSDRFTVTG